MKIRICVLSLMIITITLASCSNDTPQNISNSLNDIQNIVREIQTAYEDGNQSEANKGISKLIHLSEDPFYLEGERTIAKYCATYINAGMMLNYIIKNDITWLDTHNIDEFDVFHRCIFAEVINGQINHL